MRAVLSIFIFFFYSFQARSQWIEVSSGFQEDLRGLQWIDIVDSNIAWAVAFDGKENPADIQAYTLTTDGGLTWTSGPMQVVPPSFSASCIAGLSATKAFATFFDTVQQRGLVIKTEDGGNSWAVVDTHMFASPYGYPDIIHFMDQQVGIVIGDPNLDALDSLYFEIWRTEDGGGSWLRVPQQNIPAPLPLEFAIVGSFESVGDTMWFGTTRGRVMRSVDKGAGWTAFATALSNMDYVSAIAFQDALTGLAVGRSGKASGHMDKGIMKTTDGGENWSMLETGTVAGIGKKNAICYVPGTPSTYVITGSEDALIGSAYTTDGGDSWQNIDSVKHYRAYFQSPAFGLSGSFGTSGQGVYYWDSDLFIHPFGIGDVIAGNYSMIAFPNPATDRVQLSLGPKNFRRPIRVQLTGTLGQIIKVPATAFERTMGGYAVDLKNYPPGMYTLTVYDDNGKTASTKFVLAN